MFEALTSSLWLLPDRMAAEEYQVKGCLDGLPSLLVLSVLSPIPLPQTHIASCLWQVLGESSGRSASQAVFSTACCLAVLVLAGVGGCWMVGGFLE